eukprot:4909384-Ditylum_brightwellii.AAC.1
MAFPLGGAWSIAAPCGDQTPRSPNIVVMQRLELLEKSVDILSRKDVASNPYVTEGMYTVRYDRKISWCLRGQTTIAHPNLK